MHFGSQHRAWIDPLPLQLELIHRESSAQAGERSLTFEPEALSRLADPTSVTLGAIAADQHRVGFSDEPGP